MPIIFDIKRFALHDGPGIRTTVFFKGCPLRCTWCHNPESQLCQRQEVSQTRPLDGETFIDVKVYGKDMDNGTLLNEVLKDRLFYEESGGGVTVSGGEPFLQFKPLMELLKSSKSEGIHTAVDTSGYVKKEKLLMAAQYTDLFLYDLKLMSPKRHKQYTAKDNKLILQNIDTLLDKGNRLIFRIPLIPGINDTIDEIEAFKQYIAERKEQVDKVHLLPYHQTARDKYERLDMAYHLTDIQKPSSEHIERVRLELDDSGAEVVVGG